MKVNQIINGDCLEVLKTLPDEFVNCCITSPPYYGLRDYGVDGQIGLEETPEEYVQKLVVVFREVYRVLKDDGTLWLNLGDSYSGSGGAGNQFGQPGKEGFNKYKQRHGYKDGRANRDERLSIGRVLGLKPKDLIGIPWMVAFALRADGWYLRQDIIWHKPNPMPESVKDRCTKAHEYVFLMSKSKKYYYDADAVKEDCSAENIVDFKNRKTFDNKSNGVGTYEEASPDLCRGRDAYMPDDFKRNKRSVWTVNTMPCKEAHFATFPKKLIEPMILAGCPKGGVVLDPFIGSGTTGMLAVELQRNYLGIELNKKYVDEITNRRTANVQIRAFV
jgi:DNA modification methylase